MTAKQFKKIREKLGLEHFAWGQALGYRGERTTVQRVIRRFESGEREVPPCIERLAVMFERFGIPKDFT